MALYVYEKWNVGKRTRYVEYEDSRRDLDDVTTGVVFGKPLYVFASSNGEFTLSGNTIYIRGGESGTVYKDGGSSMTAQRVTAYSPTRSSVVEIVYRSFRREDDVKGNTLIDNLVADDGKYPNDGKYGDYWYVKKSLATAPNLIQPNGGEEIQDNYTIKWTNSIPSQKTRVELSTNDGSSWSALATVDSGVSEFNYDFNLSVATSTARVRVAHFDGQYTGAYDTSDGVFSIIHNKPPTTPTNLQPDNKPVDNTKMQFLTWTFNDPNVNDAQSKYDLRYRLQGANAWTNSTEVTSDTFKAMPPNTFNLGRIEWQVRTYDQEGEVSPWSKLAVFTSSVPTGQPTITSPSDIVGVSNPLIAWTSPVQEAYQVKVTDSGGNEVYKSAEVTSKAKAMTLPYTLLNGANYTIGVRVKAVNGLWSDWTDKRVSVSYTPPAKPVINTTYNDDGITIEIINPDPIDTQPNVVKTEVYKELDGDWLLVYVGDLDYLDLFASNGINKYKVIVYGDNSTSTVSDIVIVNYQTNNTSIINARTKKITRVDNILSTNVSRTPEKAYHLFKGRSHLVPEVGLHTNRQINLTWLVQSIADLQRYTEGFNPHDIYLYRDREGRKFFVTIDNLDESEDYEFSDYQMSMSMTEVDFYEGIDRDE